MDNSADYKSSRANRFETLKMKLTTAVGYLLPFLASFPPLAAWGGLMTVPFVIYLLMMFGNISTAPPVPNLTQPATLLLLVTAGLGLLLLFYSVVYLRMTKAHGLVTEGPYRLCRHPQYLCLIIFTLVMTYQSVWTLQHTFGIGWLSANQTKILWLLMLLAYVAIAAVEEMHLRKLYGKEWIEYRKRVGFIIPFIPMKYFVIECVIAVFIPYALLEILLRVPIIL
jgi:protein-S-isoprenylcysteine O-methyltransferase Ste14